LNKYILLGETLDNKVGEFLCWPQYEEDRAKNRMYQLEKLGVEAVAIGGPHVVLGTPIIGKGHTGVVLRALYHGQEVALKILRTDTNRPSMRREAIFLSHANEYGLGPEMFCFSHDFIVMELLQGEYFGEWVRDNLDNPSIVRAHIREILDISWRLDRSGLDHGELNRIRRHYIVTDEGTRIIDFESSSFERTPSNLTSTVQSLFLNHRFATLLKKVHSIPDKKELIDAVREYKGDFSQEKYDRVLRVCNL